MKKFRRVTRSEEFSEIINNGSKVTTSCFVLCYRDKKEEYNRVGISVPKKTGNAVIRNKVKRQVRMLIDQSTALSLPYDCIIIIRKDYRVDDFEHDKNSFQKLLKQVKI